MTQAASCPAPPTFFGRQPEGRAILLAVKAGRSVQLSAPTQYGKSALLEELRPALEQGCVVLVTPKLAPFGAWLKDLFAELWRTKVPLPGLTYSKSAAEDAKEWARRNPGNEAKARSLLDALRAYVAQGVTAPCVLIDDASGMTAGMVPWLAAFADVAAFVFAVPPEVARKSQLGRVWQKCDRVELPPLSPKEAGELIDHLTGVYGIVAEDQKAYRARILSLASGVPGEVVRLVRFVSTDALVSNRALGSGLAQQLAQREERGFALAPVLLMLGAVAIVTKYVGLARGEMDVYLLGGVGIAVFMVGSPFFRKWVQVK